MAKRKNELPKQWNQTQCPRCGNFGCPRTGGYRRLDDAVTIYRKCSHCDHGFSTFTAAEGPNKGVERVEPV